jgi:lysine 2,3-aminomutase
MISEEGELSILHFNTGIDSLCGRLTSGEGPKSDIERVSALYPFRVTSFYLHLMEDGNPSCPIRLQAIPSLDELAASGVGDPLGESNIAVTPTFFRRYPKRGVFLVTGQCAMYCRFCNRRRFVGKDFDPRKYIDETLSYLEVHCDINEIVLSGGDPFTLEPEELAYILRRLKAIHHIKTIRISSRIPVVSPERTYNHLNSIEKYGPLWCVVHTNHPREITQEFRDVVKALQIKGASVISQTVLLRGVNDCPHILGKLFEELIGIGVKPYYLFQLDDVMGATHFKVRLSKGFDIMKMLRRQYSGLCLPTYALDITGGLGKIPLESGYVKGWEGNVAIMENLYGERGEYLDNGQESNCHGCGLCKQL